MMSRTDCRGGADENLRKIHINTQEMRTNI
nr:MAG TPA: hypothetical protein [Caudoviricetes sp.]